MERRELGRTGVEVSAIGLGCWAAGGMNWGGTDDEKTTAAFHRAIDLGIDFFDAAPVYGFGHAERILGAALLGKRASVFLATKFGLVWEVEKLKSIRNNLRPESIRAECDRSLKRLQTDCIDLYQAHWPLQGEGEMTQTVCDEMLAALHGLRDAGKVRFFGVSNFSVEQMEMCGGERELVSLQPPFSILRPGAADELIPYCAEKKIGVLCYSPMFRGLLTGKYKGDETFPPGDSRASHPDYFGERFEAICDRVAELRRFAEAHGTTIAGVALNWALGEPGVTVALAGTRAPEQIEEAVRGQGWALSQDERREIAEMFAEFAKRNPAPAH